MKVTFLSPICLTLHCAEIWRDRKNSMYSGCMYFGLLRIGIVWMHADRKAIMHIYVSMFCICIQFRAVKHIRLILFNVVVLSFA